MTEWVGVGGGAIPGKVNNQSSFPDVTIETQALTSTIPIVWGDLHNSILTGEVKVTANYKKNGGNNAVDNKKSVDIKRVKAPILLGPLSIQECCTTPVTYTAVEADAANKFSWSVSAGTITSGAGTKTITVTPPVDATFSVTCVASRATGLPNYTRTTVLNVARSQPVTPKITAPSFFCTDSIYQICLPALCGMSGATWTVPASLQIVGGQGTTCLKVTPTAGATGGTTGSLSAQAIMTGACTAAGSPAHTFTVYGAEEPPAPQGYITLELESGDACHDPVYKVVWHTTHPYLNGYTSVSPGLVLGGTHPHGDGGNPAPVRITICNVNLCSGKKSCIAFWIDRPYPCIEDIAAPPGTGMQTEPNTDARTEQRTPPRVSDIQTYPNPSSGTVYLSCPVGLSGRADLFDLAGKLLDSAEFDSSDRVSSLTRSPLPKGVYILRIQAGHETITKKIIIQ